MSCSYFNAMNGVRINRGGAIITEGAGVPAGSILAAGVPAGSIWLDTVNGDIWKRNIILANDITDWSIMASEDFVNATLAGLSSGISWREPVTVRSNQAALPLATDNTVDGETVVDGMRVLFSNAGVNNVYIASGTPGAWTWTEDTNLETVGDSVYVGSGTDGGFRYTFNAANVWVRTDQTSLDELAYIRTFIGKSAAGAVLPSYTSTNIVANNDDSTIAIGKLDVAVQANTDLIGSPTTAGGIVVPTNTVNQNLDAIDDWVQDNSLLTTAAAVTAATIIDTVPAANHVVKWVVELEAANFHQASEVLVVSDGVAGVDCTEYAIVKAGTASINDVVVDGVINGSNEIQLQVTSPTTAVGVKARRVLIM